MHIPILPHRQWPSTRGKKLLASPTLPLESASCGSPFRRFVRSLSLRPSWLLAPCADPTKMVRCPPRPPRAFTSGLPVPKELPDIATAPHGNLRRRDFHPQVQQLASLRSLHGLRRRRRAAFVRPLLWYYETVRLPEAVHIRRTAKAFSDRPPPRSAEAVSGSPGSRAESFHACAGSSTPRRLAVARDFRHCSYCLPQISTRSARRSGDFGAQWLACVYPCQRFTRDFATAGA